MPGEFSQHDFAQAEVRYSDGRTERGIGHRQALFIGPGRKGGARDA